MIIRIPAHHIILPMRSRLDKVIKITKELQGLKSNHCGGTAQLFIHPYYMHGAATWSAAGAYGYAAVQVKKAMEGTHYPGGKNFVFWGGREGYRTLLNTDMKRKLHCFIRFGLW